VTKSKDKAEVIAKTLARVHSSDNLSLEEKKGREDTILRYSKTDKSVNEEAGRINDFSLEQN